LSQRIGTRMGSALITLLTELEHVASRWPFGQIHSSPVPYPHVSLPSTEAVEHAAGSAADTTVHPPHQATERISTP
jgi:hypothetical protein